MAKLNGSLSVNISLYPAVPISPGNSMLPLNVSTARVGAYDFDADSSGKASSHT